MFSARFKARSHFPLTAAVLAVLLAACGGGGGSSDSGNQTKADGQGSAGIQGGGTTRTGTSSGTSTTTTPSTAPVQNETIAGNGNTAAVPTSSQENAGDTTEAATTNSVVRTVSAPVMPVSGSGVRGDVLLTMMDQRACVDPGAATGLNGTPLYPSGMPPITADLMLNPETYTVHGKPPTGVYAVLNNLRCDDKYYSYAPMREGTYTLSVSSATHPRFTYLNMKADHPFRETHLRVPLKLTGRQITLGDKVKQGSTELNGREVSFQTDAQVSWGVLSLWQHGQEFAKMMVLPSRQPDEARLCWNIDTAWSKRLQCTVWQVPAGWARGDKLKLLDQYLVEDRSAYPGESGLRYWHARFGG